MHIRFNKIKIEVKTSGGNASSEIAFENGCNVLFTNDNTQGKSTIINSLAVGLGFDYLVRGNITALVNDTIRLEGTEYNIIGAVIFLEIENEHGEIMQLMRNVTPELEKVIYISSSSIGSWDFEDSSAYYLGKGSYQDEKGFYTILSQFIGFPKIEVLNSDETTSKLYLEYIFSATFIEQKRGWSDIMANLPYYGVREPKKTTISEILGLDLLGNNIKRSKLKLRKERLKAEYITQINALVKSLDSRQFILRGVTRDLMERNWKPEVIRLNSNRIYSDLESYLTSKTLELEEKQKIASLENQHGEIKEKLNAIALRITNQNAEYEVIVASESQLRQNIETYLKRKSSLKEELRKNNQEKRLSKLVKDYRSDIDFESCPVCEQAIDVTLVSQVQKHNSMSIEQNINYINSQLDILKNIIVIAQADLEETRNKIAIKREYITALVDEHYSIIRSFGSVIPLNISHLAREIAVTEVEIGYLEELKVLVSESLSSLSKLYVEYFETYDALESFKGGISESDKSEIFRFQRIFRQHLQRTGFNSHVINAVELDFYTLQPKVNLENRGLVKAEFGSSASDWVRIIYAFTLSLHVFKNKSTKSKHPDVSIFDEPAQQNVNKNDYFEFIKLASEDCKGGGQIIIAATESNPDFKARVKALGINIIDFGDDYIIKKSA